MSISRLSGSDTQSPNSNGTQTVETPPEAPRIHEKRSIFGALLSRTLPKYSGQYHVGVCDVEQSVEPQTFGAFRFKTLAEERGMAGLTMDSVLFSLFYPCEEPDSPTPAVWFPNMKQTIDGFIKMAQRTPNAWYRILAYPAAAAAIAGTTFPANKNAQLLTPAEESRWPLMIFSHGVGCSRLMYSAFCGEMASRGYVVASLEHRDGTSPSSKITLEDGTTKFIDWLQWSDLSWPDLEEQPKDDYTLRQEQLKMRCAEIKEVVRLLEDISAGRSFPREMKTTQSVDWGLWTNVDPTRPIMAGHSLGGSAALASSAKSGIPYSAVVAFDPATQRLAPWDKTLPHPMLIINSEEWTVGSEYIIFKDQIAHMSIVDDSPHVYCIPGATHPSFSDVFLILPSRINKMTGLRTPAHTVLRLMVDVTEAFLVGKGNMVVEKAKKFEGDTKRPKRPVGQPGELISIPMD